MAIDQEEIITEFINEVRELIEELEPTIIGLDAMAKKEADLAPEDVDTLNGIFRLFHSIKGGAGFLGFSNVVGTTHTAESLLDKLRGGKARLRQSHVDLLCHACDFTKDALEYIQANHSDDGMADSAQALMAKFSESDTTTEPHPDPSETTPPTASAAPLPPPLPDFNLEISLADFITPETRKKFVEEADDLLQEIEEDLLALTKAPDDSHPLERLFRNTHSIKGNCGFLGFKDLESLLHMQESILSTIKSGENREVTRMAEMFLEMLDVVKETVATIGREGSDATGAIPGLDLYLELHNNLLPPSHRKKLSVSSTMIGDILVQQGVVTPEAVERALEAQNKPIGELLIDSGVATKEQVDRALKVQEQLRPKAAGGEAKETKRQDIRVDLDKLDSLINLIGEMVIAENMVIHNPDLKGLVALENFNKAGQHMSKIVRELQEMAMIIRMVPVSGLFRRMIRLVHDLSRKSGKKVELQLQGEATEVDKTVIEKITDPLVHLIRNSMDHGIESPAERRAAEKQETGSLVLAASHEEGEVVIRLTDDGRGLNRQKILKKAVEKGLIPGDGSDMTDQQVFQLIFLPGFSTADQVTDISGRGVGMDVVRQNLESIKGRVDIASSAGRGTTITLRIPLTLAIIDGMQIRSGRSHYILPILSIRETFQPTPDIITVSPDGQELVRVRDQLMPVVRLHELHKIEPDSRDLDRGILIVLETRTSRNLCLFVDELLGQQQTVIKGLSEYIGRLGNVSGVSGCTILGNGEVCLILDVRALEEVVNASTS